MKKTRVMIVIISVVLFLAVLLLGSNTVFSLTQFDLTFNVESRQAIGDSVAIQNKIEEEYKGKNILFVNAEETASIFNDYRYLTVVSVEKVYPCTIKMIIEEKRELYAFKVEKDDEEVFCMTDMDGVVLRENTENINNVDGEKNFAVYGLTLSEVNDLKNDKFAAVLDFVNTFSNETGGLRTCLRSLEFRATTSVKSSHRLEIETYEGIKITIVNPYDFAEEKAVEAAKAYIALSDGDKMYGELIVVNSSTEEGKIIVNRVS